VRTHARTPKSGSLSRQSLENPFTVQCAELLPVLKSLDPKAWSRSAIVTGAGKALELTVRSYAERLAIHERPHAKQIKRIASVMQNKTL
jgi:hypothetical protein